MVAKCITMALFERVEPRLLVGIQERRYLVVRTFHGICDSRVRLAANLFQLANQMLQDRIDFRRLVGRQIQFVCEVLSHASRHVASVHMKNDMPRVPYTGGDSDRDAGDEDCDERNEELWCAIHCEVAESIALSAIT